MPEEQQKLDVEAIVEKAFEYFDAFVNRKNQLDGILLEELEPQDDGWIVAIGFNGKRQQSSEPATMAALAGFGNKTTTTVREVRHIYLDNKGSFQKIA